MSQIVKEVGTKRVWKYLIVGLWELIFRFLPYSPLRIAWMKIGGARIGKNSYIDQITFMNLDRTGLKGLEIGEKVYIGPSALLDLAGTISLGNHVTVSARAVILSHHSIGFSDHPLLDKYPKTTYRTLIKMGAVIGVGSIILPGIILNEKCMVAAGSVVNKSVESMKLVAGVPAIVKKDLKESID
jgi:acetyltransferase-like isoleucine patch superfamily enzyme